MGSLGRFLRLPFSGMVLFLQAYLLISLTALALRIGGLQRWQSLLLRFVPKSAAVDTSTAASERAHLAASLVAAAARRLPFSSNCLHQSVALWWLLRRHGFASELRIGSRFREDRFEAHAWVEYAGQVLNDSKDVHLQFTPFSRPFTPKEAGSR